MKHNALFSIMVTSLLIAGSASSLHAQTTTADTSDKQLEVLRQISWNIFRLVGGLSNHLQDFKGDSINTDGGITAYKVKNLLNMNADNEYIMVKPNGPAYYVAIITGDEARLKLYMLAFNYGIDEYSIDNKIDLVAKPDPTLSTDEKDVYALMLKDLKVGTFTREKNNNRSRIIIGFVK